LGIPEVAINNGIERIGTRLHGEHSIGEAGVSQL